VAAPRSTRAFERLRLSWRKTMCEGTGTRHRNAVPEIPQRTASSAAAAMATALSDRRMTTTGSTSRTCRSLWPVRLRRL
jgi:hypothetical protein